jgi:hypothetical protein
VGLATGAAEASAIRVARVASVIFMFPARSKVGFEEKMMIKRVCLSKRKLVSRVGR